MKLSICECAGGQEDAACQRTGIIFDHWLSPTHLYLWMIGGRLSLTPKQEALLCIDSFLADVGNCETQDERPDHSQDQFEVAVDDV